ncbi:MAG TPA: ECF transporter S component [Candidatus Olsenella pullistercoris]|uniref:Riboflavin transporter n=1 Tax=Candidatus Olsenella pullistercoris TaxID=2838712 RepID=A0A9D2JEN1_9ACTN|nr:ECF transporter S component [Candidatus Olsenella pullistercoris]
MAMSTHSAHSSHSTSSQSGSWSTRRIATTALLCALSFVLTFVEFPIFPPAPWLMYDPSGIVAFVAALAFGPSTGAVAVVLPWVLKTLFSFNPWGHLMAIVAGVALCVPAALVARRVQGPRGLALGMALGAVCSLVACVIGNIIVTPLYTAVSVTDVIAMIVPVLLPFNAIKIALNCVVTVLVSKPVAQIVSR